MDDELANVNDADAIDELIVASIKLLNSFIIISKLKLVRRIRGIIITNGN